MTNLILLLCARISIVLTVVNAAALLSTSITKEHSNTVHTYSIETEHHIDVNNCTFDHGSMKYTNCSYKQRSKTAAVLISIYFGIFGVDWFYLSRGNGAYIVVGICKLLISCGCCSGWPILALGARRFSSATVRIGYIASTLFTLLSLMWWIIDWTRILANKFPDGNGIELKHFSEYFWRDFSFFSVSKEHIQRKNRSMYFFAFVTVKNIWNATIHYQYEETSINLSLIDERFQDFLLICTRFVSLHSIEDKCFKILICKQIWYSSSSLLNYRSALWE